MSVLKKAVNPPKPSVENLMVSLLKKSLKKSVPQHPLFSKNKNKNKNKKPTALDELEKAHKDAAPILLQIPDEGIITDSQGRKVDFRNTILCLKSNIGSDILAHPSSSSSSTK